VEKLADPERPQMTVWLIRVASWIPKTTNTHSEYVILTALPLQNILHRRSSVLRYTYIASLLSFHFEIIMY
jgi:hypothetical protein